jgi:hypothetical protein
MASVRLVTADGVLGARPSPCGDKASKRTHRPLWQCKRGPDQLGGNARQQALRRLRKDQPDLQAKVLAGELSPHAATIEAGLRQWRRSGGAVLPF